MSLSFSGMLFSAANWKGKALLVGLGKSDRYHPIAPDQLTAAGLFDSVGSAKLFPSGDADANIILFQQGPGVPSYQGNFLILPAAAAAKAKWTFSWPGTESALLVATNRKGHKETYQSFTFLFRDTWDTFLDQQFAGTKGSRHGEPLLTWEMFPIGIDSLESNRGYLKIYQPVDFELPWPWNHYDAWMMYHIGLYADKQHHLRAYGARWAYWIEGGAKTKHIQEQFAPAVTNGLATLVDQVNQTIASKFDALLGAVTDVYLLPGSQGQSPAQEKPLQQGSTFTDVTIVIEH